MRGRPRWPCGAPPDPDADIPTNQRSGYPQGPIMTIIATTRPEQVPTVRQLLRPFWFVGALLMMLDGLTTWIALTYHTEAGAREGNPIAVWAITHIGVTGMCVAKVLIGVLMMWRLVVAADRGHRYRWMNRSIFLRQRPQWKVRRNAAWALAFSLVLMGVVVGNNVRAIIGLANG